MLRTYPFSRLWVAGCSTGEEVYSLAILLAEEGLADRVRDLRDRHQRGGARASPGSASSRSTRCRSTRRTTSAPAARARSPSTTSRATTAPSFAGALVDGRRLRAAQPRLGRRVQRVPRDHVPQRDDLLRPAAAGARAPALLREPRDVRGPRARAEGDDPVLAARGLVTRSSTPKSGCTRRFDELRGDRDRRVLGRAAGGGHVAGGDTGRARPGDRGRAAPLARVAPRRARGAAAAAHRAAGVASRTTRSRSSRGHVYVAPADYHLLVDGGALRALRRRPRPVRAALDRRPLRVGRRRRTASARSGSCSRARTRTARPGSPRSSGTAVSRSSRTRRRRRRKAMPEAAIAAAAGRRRAAARGDRAVPVRVVLHVSRARAKLLLVDDRPENLLALEAILEPLGQELVRAESGEEALRHLLQDEFAAILLDVQMPGMDGFQTAELIKQRERTRHVPIIFLTAISKDAEHVFRGYDAGAVDYLMKPFDPHILRAKVAVFIDLWQKTVEIRRQDALLKEQEIARARAGERGAIPVPRRRRAADRLDDGRRRQGRLLQRALVRVHRDGTRAPRLRPQESSTPTTCPRWSSAGRRRAGDRRAVRDRVPVPARRRVVPLAPRPLGLPDATTSGDDRPAGSARRPTSRTASSPRTGRRFLAEAGWVLGSSLDYEQTLTDVARLAVPRIADWCAVDIFVGGRLERLALEHVDPLKVALARELQEAMLAASGAAGAAAIRTRDAGARPRDRRRGARDVRVRRAPARDRPRARAALVRHGAARRPRRGVRLDQPRHRRVGAASTARTT